MESTSNSAAPFDLNLASVEALVETFPDLGLFSAEDIVAWREKNGPISTLAQLVDELGLPEDVAVSLLRVTCTETMAPGSGEFVTSIFPRTAVQAARVPSVEDAAEVAASPPEPGPVQVAEPEPVKAALEPAPEPVKAPPAVEPVTAEPEPAKEPAIIGSEARLAARLGIEHEEARAPRAAVFERTGVSSAAAVDPPGVAQATEQEDDPAEATSGRRTASASPKAKRSFIMPLIVAAALIGNAALGGFLLQVRAETQGVKAPVAQLTGEMHAVKEDQTQTRTELTETKSRLEKQATKLETTIDRVEATEARQRDADRAAKDAAKAEAREVATLTARLGRVEGRTEKATFKLDEAIKIIDSVQGKPGPAVDEDAPLAVVEKKSPPIHDNAPSWQSLTDSRH